MPCRKRQNKSIWWQDIELIVTYLKQVVGARQLSPTRRVNGSRKRDTIKRPCRQPPLILSKYRGDGGIVVSIAAFQAVDPGSIPGHRSPGFDPFSQPDATAGQRAVGTDE